METNKDQQNRIEKCPTCGAPANFEWSGLDLVAESGDETLASKSYKFDKSTLEAIDNCKILSDQVVLMDSELTRLRSLNEAAEKVIAAAQNYYSGNPSEDFDKALYAYESLKNKQ